MPFFLGDEYGNNGIIILGSEERLERMTRSDDWFADGMFGMVPECIGQLYSIHAVMKGAIIPSIYALLPNKMQKTYERLLNILKELQVSYRAFFVCIHKQTADESAFSTINGCLQIHLSFDNMQHQMFRETSI